MPKLGLGFGLSGTTFSSGFTPSSISGLQLWLDATTGLYDQVTGGTEVTTNNATIARWEDQSGNAYHATQSISGNRAKLQTSIQNNKNVVQFDGTDDFYTGIANAIGTFTTGTKFTFFVACTPDLSGRQASFGGGGIIGKRKYNDGRDWYFGVRSGGKFALNINGGFNACKVSGSTLTTNTTYILGASLDYDVSATPTLYLGENAETITNENGSGGWGIGDGELGRGYNGTSDYYYKGNICEIVIYNSVLSEGNRVNVLQYLKSKWAIS